MKIGLTDLRPEQGKGGRGGLKGRGRKRGRKGEIEGWFREGLIWLGWTEEEAISRLRLDRGASIQR